MSSSIVQILFIEVIAINQYYCERGLKIKRITSLNYHGVAYSDKKNINYGQISSGHNMFQGYIPLLDCLVYTHLLYTDYEHTVTVVV